MIQKKLLIILAFVFILGIGLVFAFSQTNGKWYGKTHKSCFDNSLTAEQKEAFFEAMQELKGSELSYEEMKEAKLQIMQEMEMDSTSCGMRKTKWNHGSKMHGSGCSK
jgi:hypothetical protein